MSSGLYFGGASGLYFDELERAHHPCSLTPFSRPGKRARGSRAWDGCREKSPARKAADLCSADACVCEVECLGHRAEPLTGLLSRAVPNLDSKTLQIAGLFCGWVVVMAGSSVPTPGSHPLRNVSSRGADRARARALSLSRCLQCGSHTL